MSINIYKSIFLSNYYNYKQTRTISNLILFKTLLYQNISQLTFLYYQTSITIQTQSIFSSKQTLYQSHPNKTMISNFQLKPRKCKYHNLTQEFICLNKQCQYRALLCSSCTRQNHCNHFHDIRSIQSFIQSYKQKVKFYESQFQKDKVIINVKEITKAKLSQLDQTINQIIIHLVKLLQQQKIFIKNKLLQIENKYEKLQNQYKMNLQARFDILDYLSSYKNNTKALQARIRCSSEWGIVSIKNTLNDMKNLSLNQERNVNQITENIVSQTERVLKQNNFVYSLKNFIISSQYTLNCRKQRITSFIEKSFISTNANITMANTPQSSRVVPQRPRTYSVSIMNFQRPSSNQNIQTPRPPSIQRITPKLSSERNLDNNRYIRGLRKLKLQNVIIK